MSGEWKTIDSAPKNCWLMGCSDEYGCIFVHWIDGEWYPEFWEMPIDDLTHWQPMPELPDATGIAPA